MRAVVKIGSSIDLQWKRYSKRVGMVHNVTFKLAGTVATGSYRSQDLSDAQRRVLRRFPEFRFEDVPQHNRPPEDGYAQDTPEPERAGVETIVVPVIPMSFRPSRGRVAVLRDGALGDVLLATAVIKRLHDEGFDVTVVTRNPEVFSGLPGIATSPVAPSGCRVVDLNKAYEVRPLMHVIDAYSEVAFGDHATAHRPTFNMTRHSVLNPRSVVLHAARSWPNRTMPVDWWRLVGDGLISSGWAVHWIGTDNDFYPGNGIDLRRSPANRVDSLGRTASYIMASWLMICTDSALLHLAAATTTPILGIFTCTDPALRMPEGDYHRSIYTDLTCRGCHHRAPPPVTSWGCERKDLACITSITPKMVIEAALEMLPPAV